MEEQPKRGKGRPRGTQYLVHKTLLLRPEDGDRLKQLAARRGCSEAAVVRQLIAEEWERKERGA